MSLLSIACVTTISGFLSSMTVTLAKSATLFCTLSKFTSKTGNVDRLPECFLWFLEDFALFWSTLLTLPRMSKLVVEVNESNVPVTGKLVVKLRESRLGHLQEQDEFANRLYSESTKSIQREWIQVSHRSHKIPLKLVFTGLPQIPHGNFQLGPGFVLMSPQRIGGEELKKNCIYDQRWLQMARRPQHRLKCLWSEIFYYLIWQSFQNDEEWRLFYCDSTLGCRVIDLCKLDDLWRHFVDTKWCKITKYGVSVQVLSLQGWNFAGLMCCKNYTLW